MICTATIQTAIELYDAFSAPLMNVIQAINTGVTAMDDMRSAVNKPVSMSAAETITNQMKQAAEAIEEARASLAKPVSHENTNITWNSPTMPTFTNTGIERFELEVQNANSMLEKLSRTQANIAQMSSRTSVFPPNMVSDMNTMQSRLEAIAQRIQAIENDPLTMGVDAANAELEELRSQLDRAVSEQEELNHALEKMDVQAANEAYLRLSQTVGHTERYIRDNVDEQRNFNRAIESGTGQSSRLASMIKSAVAAYASVQTVKKSMDLSDQLTSTKARLDMINDGMQSTAALQNMIFNSAERSRGSYQATADAVSKMGLMAGDAFKSNAEIVEFMEQINKQFAIAGTNSAGIDAAMLQLTQAMGSGVLRGEEFNSILEQAPTIIQAIADYMNVPKGQLKDMASEGKITANVVKSAMFAAADQTNAKFASMPKTFSQVWTSFKNSALMAFQPILQRMNELLNSQKFQDFADSAVSALEKVGDIAVGIFDKLVDLGKVVSDNWDMIKPIVYGAATALGVYAAVQVIAKIATLAASFAQWALNAAMYACPLTWIILLIIALIAVFYAAIAAINKFAGTSISATGVICGAFAAAGAIIANIFITLCNAVILVFSVIWNVIADVANFVANVFTDPINAVCRLFFDLCDTVLYILKLLAEAIDWVFGSNLAGSVQGWRDQLGGWVDKTFGKGEEVMAKMEASDHYLETFDIGEAWDFGYHFFDDDGSSGKIGSGLLNANEVALRTGAAGTGIEIGNIGAGTIAAGLAGIDNGLSGIGSGIDSIAGTTGDIADTLDITEEDLKYLRDIAEKEAINRFTTAEITIQQTNNNNISAAMDLDGVVSGLTDAVDEAVDIIAEGVHT